MVTGWCAVIRFINVNSSITNMRKQFPLILLLVLILLSGCTSQTTSASEGTNTPTTSLYLAMTPQPEDSQPLHSATPASTSAGGPGRAEYTSIPATNAPPETATPADWKSWPILPVVSAEMRAVYRLGLENGNDPHSFSILGDCQSLPEEFLGVYDNDSSVLAALPDPLQETVRYFSGSFDRYSPTVKNGTTTGALLWGEWNDNEENQCQPGETPLDCELRIHRPSIVIINIGTHWETRNYRYLTIIFEKIIEHGAVPVLATKADNRELDERVNQDLANLAEEFDLPVWNFWAAVQNLSNGGLDSNSTWELSDEAKEIHRLSALQALDAVWRAVK